MFFSRAIRRCIRRPVLFTVGLFCSVVLGVVTSITYNYQAGELLLRSHTLLPEDIATWHNPTCSQNEEDPTSALCPAASAGGDPREQIPRIIHQTYKTLDVPTHWLEAHASCKVLHLESDNWTHVLWTDETALEFIASNYNWFLDTYNHYPYAIQRADAIRYFILYHYGGIYLDLDVGCRQNLSPLLAFDAFFPKTDVFGVSNDVMGTRPHHPLFQQLINSLTSHSQNYWLFKMKYPTVLVSTGPIFVSREIISFLYQVRRLRGGDSTTSVRILHPTLYSISDMSFFAHCRGSTWHGSDVKVATFVWRHKVKLMLVLGIQVWMVYRGFYRVGTRRVISYYRSWRRATQ